MKRAGKPDGMAEVYARIVGRLNAAPSVIGGMTARQRAVVFSSDEGDVSGSPDFDSIEARNEAAAGYVGVSYDWTHGAYGRGRVTSDHHKREAERLPASSAVLDGGKVPSAMVCSSRLP